jgi:hypothetical protein
LEYGDIEERKGGMMWWNGGVHEPIYRGRK